MKLFTMFCFKDFFFKSFQTAKTNLESCLTMISCLNESQKVLNTFQRQETLSAEAAAFDQCLAFYTTLKTQKHQPT